MQLIKRYPNPGAVVPYIQVGHRHTAFEYIIAGIGKVHEANLDLLGRDPLTSEMEGSMRDWAIETLAQQAYLREYHLWEKDCKAYFAEMAERNGVELNLKPRGGQPFTGVVRDAFAAFDVDVPSTIFDAIEAMRQRVNTMKHEAGLELDHFVTVADYEGAVAALESFWEYLTRHERFIG